MSITADIMIALYDRADDCIGHDLLSKEACYVKTEDGVTRLLMVYAIKIDDGTEDPRLKIFDIPSDADYTSTIDHLMSI
jgi:hypothetical protein